MQQLIRTSRPYTGIVNSYVDMAGKRKSPHNVVWMNSTAQWESPLNNEVFNEVKKKIMQNRKCILENIYTDIALPRKPSTIRTLFENIGSSLYFKAGSWLNNFLLVSSENRPTVFHGRGCVALRTIRMKKSTRLLYCHSLTSNCWIIMKILECLNV